MPWDLASIPHQYLGLYMQSVGDQVLNLVLFLSPNNHHSSVTTTFAIVCNGIFPQCYVSIKIYRTIARLRQTRQHPVFCGMVIKINSLPLLIYIFQCQPTPCTGWPGDDMHCWEAAWDSDRQSISSTGHCYSVVSNITKHTWPQLARGPPFFQEKRDNMDTRPWCIKMPFIGMSEWHLYGLYKWPSIHFAYSNGTFLLDCETWRGLLMSTATCPKGA